MSKANWEEFGESLDRHRHEVNEDEFTTKRKYSKIEPKYFKDKQYIKDREWFRVLFDKYYGNPRKYYQYHCSLLCKILSVDIHELMDLIEKHINSYGEQHTNYIFRFNKRYRLPNFKLLDEKIYTNKAFDCERYLIVDWDCWMKNINRYKHIFRYRRELLVPPNTLSIPFKEVICSLRNKKIKV